MIGILAGMGPKSTAPFVDKVVQLCQRKYAAKNDIDFPPMMIYSCPTPFYTDRPLDHAALEDAIIMGARKLASTGVNFIAIPCNTAHRYYESIRKSVDIPVLNIVDETIKHLPNCKGRVALLSTTATLESGIYQAGLAVLECEFVWQESWQHLINQVIMQIKEPYGLDQAHASWQKLLREIGTQADSLILGCTDLDIVADQHPATLPIIDAGLCLAHAVVDHYYAGLNIVRSSI